MFIVRRKQDRRMFLVMAAIVVINIFVIVMNVHYLAHFKTVTMVMERMVRNAGGPTIKYNHY